MRYAEREDGVRIRDEETFDAGDTVRLGEDVRLLLVAVGGGAVRIGAEVARRHVRYLETAAINCDSRVQEVEEFDRRIFLGGDAATTDGASGLPSVAGRLAHAAEPALDRLVDGATIVVVVASLGGGTGTGALPYVVEAASRAAEFVTVFAVKPFEAEGERRAVAERSLARLHFLEAFTDKREGHRASLHVLDNQRFARERAVPVRALAERWGELIATHVHDEFVVPLEAAVEAHRRGRLTEVPAPVRAAPTPVLREVPPSFVPPAAPMPLAPQMDAGPDVELTFEVFPPDGPGPTRL